MKKVVLGFMAVAMIAVGAMTIFPPNDNQTAASDPFDPMAVHQMVGSADDGAGPMASDPFDPMM